MLPLTLKLLGAGERGQTVSSSTLTFLGIPGSLRSGSHSLAALQAMRALLPQNVRLNLFNPQCLPLSRKLAGTSEVQDDQIAELKRQIRAADAVILAVPEYLYGVTAVMNDIIDCAAQPAQPAQDNALIGKPVAVIGVSSSRRSAAHAQEHLRLKLHSLGMLPVDQPEVLVRTSYTTSFFGEPRPFMEEASRALVCEVLASLVAATPPGAAARIAKMVLTSGSLHFGRHSGAQLQA